MRDDALGILDRLANEKPRRESRFTDLLKDPVVDHDSSWAMCLPPAFNDALDIRQTERVVKGKRVLAWTQGAAFSFKAGDTIYDTPTAYDKWSDALRTIHLCIQVREASGAGLVEGSTIRHPGVVRFAAFRPNADRASLDPVGEHTLTQDDFVRFLITGKADSISVAG